MLRESEGVLDRPDSDDLTTAARSRKRRESQWSPGDTVAIPVVPALPSILRQATSDAERS
jgi:hypothetical protein